jgi:hypothetical protein
MWLRYMQRHQMEAARDHIEVHRQSRTALSDHIASAMPSTSVLTLT